jgi:hypothetical protein
MAKAGSSIVIAAPAEAVWHLIGGFGSLPDWLPFTPRSELQEGGRIRHLVTSHGEVIVERLMAFDERERSYTYHILQAPFPVVDYYSTIKVTSIEDGRTARVDWRGEFVPRDVSDDVAIKIFQGIYEEALGQLAKRFDQAPGLNAGHRHA